MPKKKKFPLKQTGITEDNKPIYGGIYKFYETYGLPLDVIFISFQEKDWVPDWVDFYLHALKAGMDHNRIISKLDEAISDSFGKNWSHEVIVRLNKLFNSQD
jgi:hypothetical protein